MQPSARKITGTSFFRHFPRLAGIIVAILGTIVMAGWFAHWPILIQLSPDLAPMKFDTALSFIFCGAGLFLLTTRRVDIAPIPGAIPAAVGLVTLLEYLTRKNLLLDQLFVRDHITTATAFPGRMSPLAASCFLFLGTALLLTGLNSHWKWRLTATGLLAAIVAVIATIALCGYIFGIEAAYGWGAYTRMALHTSAAFFLMGMGLLLWAWQMAQQENFNFLRWLPVTAALTLMAMIGFISAVNMKELNTATLWREHTIEVILAGQSFEDNLIEIQRGARGYATLGDTNALASFQNCAALEPQQFDRLVKFTSDNSLQQTRLKQLASAMNAVFDYDKRIIGIYQIRGADAVLQMDKTGEGRALFGRAHDVLEIFSAEEKNLLVTRDAAEQTDFHNAESLLIFAAVSAAILLLLASFMASWELTFRRRAEARLHQAVRLQDAILNSSDYGIISTDPNGVTQTFNAAAEKMLGYRAAEIVGKATPMLWRDQKEIAERAENLSKKLGMPVRPTFDAIAKKVQFDEIDEGEWTFIHKNGERFTAMLVVTALTNETGNFTGFLGVFRDISARRQSEIEREKLIVELRDAIAQVKTLSGLIPICGWCKSVRNDSGYWQTVEQYVRSHTDATFTHGICPACREKFKADIARANGKTEDKTKTSA